MPEAADGSPTSVLQYRSRMARQQAWRSPSAAQRRHLSAQAEVLCRRVLEMDATDGRAYVGLGKVLVAQRRHEEARKVYEEGAAATGRPFKPAAGSAGLVIHVPEVP